jgi:hypothetical protein
VVGPLGGELFETCIDSLRYLVDEKTRRLIMGKPGLLEKVGKPLDGKD